MMHLCSLRLPKPAWDRKNARKKMRRLVGWASAFIIFFSLLFVLSLCNPLSSSPWPVSFFVPRLLLPISCCLFWELSVIGTYYGQEVWVVAALMCNCSSATACLSVDTFPEQKEEDRGSVGLRGFATLPKDNAPCSDYPKEKLTKTLTLVGLNAAIATHVLWPPTHHYTWLFCFFP